MPKFGTSSLKKLSTINQVLQEVCNRVVQYRDITILVGHRSKADQNSAYKSGRSTKKYPDSKHNLTPSMAVDVAPWPLPENWGDLTGKTLHARDMDWKERVKFYEIAALCRFAFAQLCDDFPEIKTKFRLRCGADWNGNSDYKDQTFDDLPHIELVELKPREVK